MFAQAGYSHWRRATETPFNQGRRAARRGPVGAIDGIDVERDGRLTKSVTLRVGGIAIGIETARGQPGEDLPRALARDP